MSKTDSNRGILDIAFEWRGEFVVAVMAPAIAVAIFNNQPDFLQGTLEALIADCAGFLLFIAGLAIRFWATLYIGGRKNRTVVDNGPYAMCRNPLYLGTFLVAVASGLMLHSMAVVAAAVIVGAFFRLMVIPAEQRHLAAKFGDEYRKYLASTPAVCPCFRKGVKQDDHIDVSLAHLILEVKRNRVIIMLPVVFAVIAYLRATAPWWPQYFSLPRFPWFCCGE